MKTTLVASASTSPEGNEPTPDTSPVVPEPTPLVAGAATLIPIGKTSSILGSTVPAEVRRWEPYIMKYANQYQLDPNLVAAVMMTESQGNPQATSRMGAIGLMQVVNGSYDPDQNVGEGTRILATNLGRFGGHLDWGLAAYNAGAGAVDKFQGVPPYFETETYVYVVLNRYYLYSPAG